MSNHNLYPHLNQQQTPGSFDDYDSIIDEFSSIGRHDDGSDVSSMQLSELGGASVNIASAQPTPSGSPARSGASGSVRSVRFADDAGDGGGGAAQFVTASSTLRDAHDQSPVRATSVGAPWGSTASPQRTISTTASNSLLNTAGVNTGYTYTSDLGTSDLGIDATDVSAILGVAESADQFDEESLLAQRSLPSVGQSSLPSAFEDDLFLERFKRRRDEASSKIEAERQHRPPSNSTHFAEPKNVVTSILDGMLRPHEPVPYFGYEILYSSSTPHWKDVLRKSVGAPIGTEEELIFRALSTSMERANNQFGILVGLGTDHDDYDDYDDSLSSKAYYHHDLRRHDDYYTIDFPWDTLDYYDGTAWVECRLRDKQSDELYVVLGWSMQRRESDGAWLIDGIDWQDFRPKYRPGIGREEWERICG